VTYLLLQFLFWSYVLGGIFFAIEQRGQLKKRNRGRLYFGLFFLALSPIIAWWKVLHYGQELYCKLTGQPTRYWI
jgi:hypothetical protein